MDSSQRRASREEAMAIKAEVDYQRLVSYSLQKYFLLHFVEFTFVSFLFSVIV